FWYLWISLRLHMLALRSIAVPTHLRYATPKGRQIAQSRVAKSIMGVVWSILLLPPLIPTPLYGGILFSDNFESGLSSLKWGTNNSGQVTVDPQNASNHVVRFATQASGGDLYSVL